MSTDLISKRQETYRQEVQRLFDFHQNENIACKHFFKSLPPEEKKRLDTLVAETKFNRRRYSKSVVYCWPIHPVFTENGIDPWPAVIYPINILRKDFAIRI